MNFIILTCGKLCSNISDFILEAGFPHFVGILWQENDGRKQSHAKKKIRLLYIFESFNCITGFSAYLNFSASVSAKINSEW